jgi:hypothetical protein
MRYLLCIAATLFCTAAYSQIDLKYINRVTKRPHITTDKQHQFKAENVFTPLSFSEPKNKTEEPDPTHDTYSVRTLRYQHTTSTGFDVYASPAHNMPVLIPDSANAATYKMKVLAMHPAQKRFGVGK